MEQEKCDEMLEAAKPLIKWINDNCHPHHVIHVDHTTVELFESSALHKTTEFLKD